MVRGDCGGLEQSVGLPVVTRPASWLEAGLCIIVLLLGFSLWQERREPPSEAHQVAHQATVRADTVRVIEHEKAKAARVIYRTLRDTLLRTTTDTLTRIVLAAADSVIVRDSIAIAASDTVSARLRDELRIALIRQPDPRLVTVVAVYYEPLTALPSASVQVGLRVIRTASVVARIDQRLADRPRLSVGLALAF